ncbi:hypothetical protein [Streptomyces chartreusis]
MERLTAHIRSGDTVLDDLTRQAQDYKELTVEGERLIELDLARGAVL